MHPDLFHIGPVPIRSYGVMLALSFILGTAYIWWIARRDNKPVEEYVMVAYVMIIAGIVGGRLFYVVTHLNEFSGQWATIFNPFASGSYGIAGMNLYGGVLLAIVSSFVYLRVRGIGVLDTFDHFAPTLGIGLALTRIGCYLNGCCFGTPCDLPWAVSFPLGSIPFMVYGPQPLHPAQLYSSAYGLLLFIVLHRIMKHRRFVGQVVAVLFMTEAVFRFAIEYVRYYEREMFLSMFGLHPTWNQVVSVGLFLIGLGIYLYGHRRTAASPG